MSLTSSALAALEARVAVLEEHSLASAAKLSRADCRLNDLEDGLQRRPPSGRLETAWVVKIDYGIFVGMMPGQVFNASMPEHVLFLKSMPDAQALSRLLGVGEPKLVYKDTLEEVSP